MNLNYHFFDKEISYINDENKRNWCVNILKEIPKYIWEVGASSTGNYHPSYTLGALGLQRHVQGALRIAIELFKCESCFNFTDEEKDNILIAILFHDCQKSGTQEDYEKSKWTKHNHPILASKFLIGCYKKGINNIDYDSLTTICKLINSHMGHWCTNPKSNVILPTPNDDLQRFVHLADYLASRKLLEVNFNVGISY